MIGRRLLPPVLLAALLLAPLPARAGGGSNPPAPAAAAWKPATCGKGSLEVLPSGLAVLRLAGTPEEMGEQHGTLLRDAVVTLTRDYLPKVLRGPREAALEKARVLEKRIPERHLREMRALAKAAGVPYDDVLLGSVVVELFGLHGCSGAAASGAATADGRTILGRNLEWPDHGVLGRYGLVVAARPEGQRPFLSLGFPAFVGVVTGMNGDGVCAAELVVMNARASDPAAALQGVPYPILLRRILEESGDLEAAAKLVRGSPLTVPQNLLLADPSAGLVLECGAGRCVDRKQEDGLVVVTNYFGESKQADLEDPRYGMLCADFAALGSGKVGEDSMEKAIRDVSLKSPAALMNLQGCVFSPATLRARVALGSPPAVRKKMIPLDVAPLLGVVPPADRKPADAK